MNFSESGGDILHFMPFWLMKGFMGTLLDQENLYRDSRFVPISWPLTHSQQKPPYGGMLTLSSGLQIALFQIVFRNKYSRLKRSTSSLLLSQENVPIVVTSVASSSPSSTLSSATIGSTRERSRSCVMHVDGHLLTSPLSGGIPQ